MGILTRLLIPRGIRRAAHPGRAIKRAVTPKVVEKARRALSPLDNAAYGVARKLNTKPRRRSPAPSYRHGTCSVKHRSIDAMSRCRRTN